MSCECTGCCDTEFADFPDVIYVRIAQASIGLDIYAPMHKIPVPVVGGCCNNLLCYSGVNYETKMMSYRDPPAAHPVCCFSMHLRGTCAGIGISGDCIWEWSIEDTDGELHYADWPTYEPFSTTCLIEGAGITIKSAIVSVCLPSIIGEVALNVTTSETEPGSPSVEMGPCVPQCCSDPDPPDMLYLTITSECPEINGKVIPMHLYDAHVIAPYGTVPIPSGEDPVDGPVERRIEVTWIGVVKLCNCLVVTFTVTNITYTHPTAAPGDPCTWEFSASTCFEPDTQTGGSSTDFCSPVTFSGNLAGGCPSCCTDAEEFTYTAELTE